MFLDKDGGLQLQPQIKLGNLALLLAYGGDYEMDDRETFSMQGQCQACASFPPLLPAFIWKVQCKPALGPKKPSHTGMPVCILRQYWLWTLDDGDGQTPGETAKRMCHRCELHMFVH